MQLLGLPISLPSLQITPQQILPKIEAPKLPQIPTPQILTALQQKETEITTLIATLQPIKAQLHFHTALLHKHSQPFLYLLHTFKPPTTRKHWSRFNPYRLHHLLILKCVFINAFTEVTREESVLEVYLAKNILQREVWDRYIIGDTSVDNILSKWRFGVEQLRLGKLILDSYQMSDESGNLGEKEGSADVRQVLEMLAAVWDEEVDGDYYACFPEERPGFCYSDFDDEEEVRSTSRGRERRERRGRRGVRAAYYEMGEGEESVLRVVDERGRFRGPRCLRRQDDRTLVYDEGWEPGSFVARPRWRRQSA
ncbi:hypothetical protein TWF694_011165 [Orbilia ellipsospora]|uniref:Uncharacterized protein n=1 Tax=Orbilia ellipsospora TaxID=2528407 RepID=A0AAV9X9F9_9PEZI